MKYIIFVLKCLLVPFCVTSILTGYVLHIIGCIIMFVANIFMANNYTAIGYLHEIKKPKFDLADL